MSDRVQSLEALPRIVRFASPSDRSTAEKTSRRRKSSVKDQAGVHIGCDIRRRIWTMVRCTRREWRMTGESAGGSDLPSPCRFFHIGVSLPSALGETPYYETLPKAS